MEDYQKHLQRTMNAVQMKPVDKIPFSYSGPAYLAKRQGLKVSEFVSDLKTAVRASADFCLQHPGVDSIHSPTMGVYNLPVLWLSEVKVPGKDLPENEIWQMFEKENMAFEDYEHIIQKGYMKWFLRFAKEKLGNPLPKTLPFLMSAKRTERVMRMQAGIPIMNGASIGSPMECFCGGRQMANFLMDMMEEPELVKAAMDTAQKSLCRLFEMQLKINKPVAAWVGGWRAAPQMISHDSFMEFAWPYIKELIQIALKHNVVPVLHFDSCWDREMETLKELPPRSCILMLDGTTDMRKAREVLDDRMCLLGDVPATMLAFGSAAEVYQYCTNLISDVGPKTGFILSSGCDVPYNAKDENVDAMIQASLDFLS